MANILSMSRIRLLLAWLVVAAIPLQGFASASMLFCGMDALQQQVQVQVQVQGEHDHAAHGHTKTVTKEAQADADAQLPDAAHTCGVCASCCHSPAISQTDAPLATASLPQAKAAEPFVLIHRRASPVPDKPPRA